MNVYIYIYIYIYIYMYINSNVALREIREPLCSIHSPVDHFLLVGLANAFLEEWRRVLRTNETPDRLNPKNS